MENAEVVAWVCVGTGMFALLLGCLAGLFRTPDGIVSSVSERTRFAGLLVLAGALLISVATIQFGGVSIF